MNYLHKVTGQHLREDLTNEQYQSVLGLIGKRNIGRTKVLASIVILLETLLIVFVDLPRISQESLDNSSIFVAYLIVHSVVLFSTILVIGLILYFGKKELDTVKANNQIIYPFYVAMLICMAIITGLDQLTINQITVYIASMLLIGAFIYCQPPYHLLVFGVPHIVFVIMIALFQPDPLLKTADMVNGTLAVGVLVGFSSISFENVFKNYANFVKLEDTRTKLEQRNHELQEALIQVKTLSGLVPICANCKKIRDDEGYWHQIEVYIETHSEAEFTHGICPECKVKLYPEFYKKG